MTAVVPDLAVPNRRERLRGELAELLDRDVSNLEDSARLADELALDSMAMVRLLAWLGQQGLAFDADQAAPARIGELLSLLERVAGHSFSIQLSGGEAAPPGPADVAVPVRTRPRAGSLAPALSNRSLRLEPIGVDDINFLYTLAVDPEVGFRWRYRGSPPPVDQFVRELWDQVLVQFVARRVKDHTPAGHLVCYGPDPGRRYAYVGAVFLPEYMGSGLGARAVIMFIRYLFHTFTFTKLYMEIPGFNWPLVSSGEGRLFHVEGILRDHEYYAGQAWDKYLCAIYPDAERHVRV